MTPALRIAIFASFLWLSACATIDNRQGDPKPDGLENAGENVGSPIVEIDDGPAPGEGEPLTREDNEGSGVSPETLAGPEYPAYPFGDDPTKREYENDPTEPPPGPIPGTTPPAGSSATFRAASWNLFRMSKKKARETSPFGGGLKKHEVVLETMKRNRVHIAGFQEIYLWERSYIDTKEGQPRPAADENKIKAIKATAFAESPSDHPLLRNRTIRGYKIYPGPKIQSWDLPPSNHKDYPEIKVNWTVTEYAPIIVDEDVLRCGRRSGSKRLRGRQIHKLECRVKEQNVPPQKQKKFTFMNAHFPANNSKNQNFIGAYKSYIDGYKVTQGSTRVARNAIIAMDANSSPHGLNKTHWNRPPRIPSTKVTGAFTKIHKKTNPADASKYSIHINKTASYRFLDDIQARGDPRKWCLPGSKQVIAVSGYPMTGSSQAQWKKYYQLSDHLPIKADFDPKKNTMLVAGC